MFSKLGNKIGIGGIPTVIGSGTAKLLTQQETGSVAGGAGSKLNSNSKKKYRPELK